MLFIKNATLKNVIKFAVPAVIFIVALLCAVFVRDGRKYAVVTVLVSLLSLLLFFAGIDRRAVGARRTVLGAVFTALATFGRFIPVIKPMTALTAIAGIYLGPETGFLVGALSALISNIWFGQGPWTPLQMTALGLIGFFAGILSEPLRKRRTVQLVFAVLSGIFYSAFMDVWSASSMSGSLELSVYAGALLSALPFTLTYVVSNAAYLLLLIPVFDKKLGRIKIKYGI